MMYEEDIKTVNEWFDEHTSFGTYHSDDEYAICDSDLSDFADFLAEHFPDLVGIRCFFGKGDSAIWFHKEDLEKAEFY